MPPTGSNAVSLPSDLNNSRNTPLKSSNNPILLAVPGESPGSPATLKVIVVVSCRAWGIYRLLVLIACVYSGTPLGSSTSIEFVVLLTLILGTIPASVKKCPCGSSIALIVSPSAHTPLLSVINTMSVDPRVTRAHIIPSVPLVSPFILIPLLAVGSVGQVLLAIGNLYSLFTRLGSSKL